MVRTRVGYAGGTTKDPTYYRLGDHSETVQIEFDPTEVSYEELLEVFWQTHNPAVQPWSRQYMSVIFYHNDGQRKLAEESRDREEAWRKGKVFTEILPASEFYVAEAYHQKYRLRQMPELMRELSTMYPDSDDFVNSTAVARVNGYIGGFGTYPTLQEEIGGFGLSLAGSEILLGVVSEREHQQDGETCPSP